MNLQNKYVGDKKKKIYIYKQLKNMQNIIEKKEAVLVSVWQYMFFLLSKKKKKFHFNIWK